MINDIWGDLTVTFTPDSDGYGTLACSWEDETHRRKNPRSRVTEEAARKFAEGFSAEFVVRGAW